MRINIIPVDMLADQHLVAEYREIKMLPKALSRTINSKSGLVKSKISQSYVLNTGHGYFFYNKIPFIENRFNELIQEMQKRGFSTNFNNLYDDYNYKFIENISYTPSHLEMKINSERILLRIYEMIFVKNKPSFYKLNGVTLTWQEWINFYQKFI